MRFLRYTAAPDPNETPEAREARLERLRRLREAPLPERTLIGSYPCACGSRMAVYERDIRAHGWLRGECPACDAWCDIEPSKREVILNGFQ